MTAIAKLQFSPVPAYFCCGWGNSTICQYQCLRQVISSVLGHENSLVFIIDIRCLGYSNDQGSYFVELTEQVKCEDWERSCGKHLKQILSHCFAPFLLPSHLVFHLLYTTPLFHLVHHHADSLVVWSFLLLCDELLFDGLSSHHLYFMLSIC